MGKTVLSRRLGLALYVGIICMLLTGVASAYTITINVGSNPSGLTVPAVVMDGGVTTIDPGQSRSFWVWSNNCNNNWPYPAYEATSHLYNLGGSGVNYANGGDPGCTPTVTVTNATLYKGNASWPAANHFDWYQMGNPTGDVVVTVIYKGKPIPVNFNVQSNPPGLTVPAVWLDGGETSQYIGQRKSFWANPTTGYDATTNLYNLGCDETNSVFYNDGGNPSCTPFITVANTNIKKGNLTWPAPSHFNWYRLQDVWGTPITVNVTFKATPIPVTYDAHTTGSATVYHSATGHTINVTPAVRAGFALTGVTATSGTCTDNGNGTWKLQGVTNLSGTSVSSTYVDIVPPSAPSVTGATVTSNPRPTWSWTPGGGGNGVYRWDLDGSGWTETTVLSFTPGSDLSGGTHRLSVQERDDAGNWSVSSFFDIFVDLAPPVIDVCPASQSGECPATVANFVPGVTAHDNYTVPGNLVITQSPAAGTPVGLGPHTVTITVTDEVNHQSTCETTFTSSDTVAPVITLAGSATVTVECGGAYSDDGAMASDTCAGSVAVTAGGSVNTGAPGVYTLTYNATDGTNAAAEVTRVVTVSDTVPPVITLTGSATVAVECGSTYSDAGATASDVCAGSPAVTTGGSVNTGAPGAYTLTYSATDGTSAAAEVTRVVTVSDTTAPVITACPPDQTVTVDIRCEASVPDFTAQVAASDACDTNPTVVQSPTAGTRVLEGETVVTLTVTDDASNFVTCTAKLTVLAGSCNTTIPNVVGLSRTAAETALLNAHLVVGHLSSHCGDADIPGMVVGQVPAASADSVPSYSAVNLVVSQGRCQTGECPAP